MYQVYYINSTVIVVVSTLSEEILQIQYQRLIGLYLVYSVWWLVKGCRVYCMGSFPSVVVDLATLGLSKLIFNGGNTTPCQSAPGYL